MTNEIYLYKNGHEVLFSLMKAGFTREQINSLWTQDQLNDLIERSHARKRKMKVVDLEEFYTKVISAWYQHEFPEDLEEELEYLVEEYRLKEEDASL